MRPDDAVTGDMVWIPGGTFRMGSNDHYPEEAPVHRVSVDGFWMDRTPVTNRQFKAFVTATGHITTAQIVPDPRDYPGALPEMLYAGSLVFTPPSRVTDLRDWSQWWSFMKGANWRHPYGPKSNIKGLDDHPVVHVSFEDALAYAKWAARIFLPKQNGNSLRAAGSMARSSPGAIHLCPVAGTWPTSGRGTFQSRICARTDTSGPRRSPPFPLTATASTT
jgi:hypothetical protein